MKKILFSILSVAALLCQTSCDDDEKKAFRLSGDWQGDFYSCYEYYYRSEREPRKAYAEETYMQFIPDHLFGSTRGTGYELDIYTSGPIEYMFYEFDWVVNDDVIYLDYMDAPEMNVEIYEYRLTPDRFKGYFGKNRYSFDLRSFSDYDWNMRRDHYHLRDGESLSNGYQQYSRSNEAGDDEVVITSVKREFKK